MDVAGISGTSPPQGADTGVADARRGQALGTVATLFKESTEQLDSELKSKDVSLATLAEQKGVSKPDLVDAIKTSLEQKYAADGAKLSPTQLTNMANRIAHHKHGKHRAHGQGTDLAASSTPNVTPNVGSPSVQ